MRLEIIFSENANHKENQMRPIRIVLLALVAAILVGCGTSSTVPITGRKRTLMVSDEQVLSLSNEQYNQYMRTAKPSTNAANTAMVKRVGQNLANAVVAYLNANGLGSEVSQYKWEFNLVQDQQVNAFCMPGGKIVVYTGMLNLIGNGKDRDDMLAAVIGHEVGHAIAKHGNERASQQLLAQLGSSVLGAAVANKSEKTQQAVAVAYGLGAQYGALLPFSRKQELEADYIGIVLATLAGYEANAAITLWEKMSAVSQSTTAEFMSTHPSSTTRIAQLKKDIPEVKKQLGVK